MKYLLVFLLLFCGFNSSIFAQNDTLNSGFTIGTGAYLSTFNSRKTKMDTVLINCICFEQPQGGTIVYLSTSNAYFSSKRLERTLTEFRITKTHYPYPWADEFLTTRTKWIDNVDNCYILNSASGYSFNDR